MTGTFSRLLMISTQRVNVKQSERHALKNNPPLLAILLTEERRQNNNLFGGGKTNTNDYKLCSSNFTQQYALYRSKAVNPCRQVYEIECFKWNRIMKSYFHEKIPKRATIQKLLLLLLMMINCSTIQNVNVCSKDVLC